MRSASNYDTWRYVIKRHPLFAKVVDCTIERQKKSAPEASQSTLWRSLTKNEDYKQSTKNEFQSLLLKIIYCLIEEENLNDHAWYNCDRELTSLLEGKPLMDVEVFIERLLRSGDVGKKRLQAIINFYTNSVGIAKYWIPSNVEMPKDAQKRKEKEHNKTVVLHDDFIVPFNKFIDEHIKFLNHCNSPALMRAAIAFCIIQGTGLRITNAYQIKVTDLQQIYEKNEHKVEGLVVKHGKTDFCYVTCKNKKALKNALDLYSRCPHDLLNKISTKSPTRTNDFKELERAVKKHIRFVSF
jgi:hypothetical protein